jgi:hypothetical protein
MISVEPFTSAAATRMNALGKVEMATSDTLLERAMRRTNISDFGPDGWQKGFEHLVAAIAVDVNDDDVRRIEANVVDRLATRLRIQSWYAQHGAEAAAHVVEGPLLILGTGVRGPLHCINCWQSTRNSVTSQTRCRRRGRCWDFAHLEVHQTVPYLIP